jgi:hypothetical protein
LAAGKCKLGEGNIMDILVLLSLSRDFSGRPLAAVFFMELLHTGAQFLRLK